jgi:hypothetical protein
MSGDAEIPPTYYFSGITFNPSFYQSSSSDYLTLATAKSSFLTYPTAQGTETITTLISSSIDSISTSNDLTLALSQIGGVCTIANGARTGNINIGANATQGNINFGSNTNDETRISGNVVDIGYKQATGNIIIGGDQTTGTINIGVKAGRLAAGAINICSTDQTNSLVIPIKIGNSSSTTAMNGTCTFAKQISASAGITAGTINGTSLVLGTGNITSCGTITATGLIKADGGIELPSGDALNVLGSITGSGAITTSGDISTSSTGTISTASGGSIKSNTFDSIATGSSMTIGNLMTSSTTLTLGANSLIKVKSPAITNTGSTPSTQAATNTNLYGGLMWSSISANYTIPSNINREFFLVVQGVTRTITMPALTIHQIINIKVLSASPMNITTPVATTVIYPKTGGNVTNIYAMPGDSTERFYCDGSSWFGY